MDYNQIKQLKEQYKDALMFVRIGDFYEAFADDAIKLSEELNLTLTGRNAQGVSGRVPMTGVPYYALDNYVAKLIEKGYKVAVAESTGQHESNKARHADIVKKASESGLMIKSEITGWSDWPTKSLPDDVRKAAEWIIINGYEDENDVRSAFSSRQTSHMSDDIDAERKDNAAIMRVAEKYRKKEIEAAYKVTVTESPNKNAEAISGLPISKNQEVIKENKRMEPNANIVPYTDERRAEIVEQSKEFFNKLLEAGKLKNLLCTVGRNGKYTLNNTLFMLANSPDITVVKNMTEWNGLGRSIIPNSKSLEVMSPIKEERTVTLKEGEEPEYDEDGQPIVKKYTVVKGFKPAYVFDISQTEGKEYKPFELNDKISDKEKKIILSGIRYELNKRGYTIDFVDADKLSENESGRVNRKDKKVEIKKGMSNYATTLALLHNSATALISSLKYSDFEGLKGNEAQQLESSCMDCILAAQFGMDTNNFDFSYTAAWNDDEKTAFYNNANLVCLSTSKLMEGVSNAFEYNASQAQGQNANTAPSQAQAARPSLFRGSVKKQDEAEAS